MVLVQRFYVDGKLAHTTKPNTLETLRRWTDNMEKEWSQHIPESPKAAEAMRGCNQGKTVTRVSLDELHVLTTEDFQLRWIIVERAK